MAPHAAIIRTGECTADKLPAVEIAEAVNYSLRLSPCLVVTAPPGAGKSTLLPLSMLGCIPGTVGVAQEGKILMLEPRRIAARQIASRMAWLLGESVGETVGYRTRFDTRVSRSTRIEVLTEGILTRMITEDPTLDGVNTVIFDEFHERSLNTDLALALTRESFRIIRPDLRIVIMSATIDSSTICKALDAPHIESKGRSYPVEIRHSEENCARDVAKAILRYHREQEGNILAFLPGESEIRTAVELLGDSLGSTKVLPLYGMLGPEEQMRAIAPTAKGERKVVLATPIAETSITIEGVRIVIDSGLCRRQFFDRRTGLSRLETVRISMDMADQRSGRAGRTAPGICQRLWTAGTERRMEDSRRPEILDSDLTPMVLEIAAWGENSIEGMQWLTPPPGDHLAQARGVLRGIGAIDDESRITARGIEVAALPCHPRIANMLVTASDASAKALGADIAALLEEKDRMSLERDGADICLRLEEMRINRRSHGWARTARVAEQYRALVKVRENNSPADPLVVGKLIAAAYPERIAQSKGCGHFLLANGETAKVNINDPLAVSDYISIASLNQHIGGEGWILLASPVAPDDTGLITERDIVAWDSRSEKVLARRERRIGRLLISERSLSNISREEITAALCDAAAKDGLSMFDFNDEVQNLQRRIASAETWAPGLGLPDVSTGSLLAGAGEWLPMVIGNASSAQDLKRIDLCAVIWGQLSYEQQKTVDRLAPSHIEVPTGSRIRLEYRQGSDRPILRVRLQECFGMTDTPRVGGGKVPVTMELLSPGFKPVQLTSDLRSFWSGTYFEVRKELRIRYPKHSWPEDPLTAPAIRGAVRKKKD
ncbi:MAG: ATP-dependent helicase HrpB [Bacteroidia bacterium]|nr:ATP-dependent helicase HrpB [Bacteroidia bacterium]